MDGHSDCAITTEVKIHKLDVTVDPAVICSDDTTQVTAKLDGADVTAVTWSTEPNDGKLTIDTTGKITATKGAADSYTIKGTDTATGCIGTATVSLVNPEFQEARHCSGFYAGVNGGNPTVVLCEGETKIVKLKSTGVGALFLTSGAPSVVTITDPKDGKVASPGTFDIKVTGGSLAIDKSSADTKIEVHVGSATGHVCATLNVKVLKLITLNVKGVFCFDDADNSGSITKGDHGPDKTKFNFKGMVDEATQIYEAQACIKFNALLPVSDLQVTKKAVEDQKLTSSDFKDSIDSPEATAFSLSDGLKPPAGIHLSVLMINKLDNTDPKFEEAVGFAFNGGTLSIIPEEGAAAPRTLAHEFGHNLDLPHVDPNKGSLMDTTGSGSCLSLAEVMTARANAESKVNSK